MDKLFKLSSCHYLFSPCFCYVYLCIYLIYKDAFTSKGIRCALLFPPTQSKLTVSVLPVGTARYAGQDTLPIVAIVRNTLGRARPDCKQSSFPETILQLLMTAACCSVKLKACCFKVYLACRLLVSVLISVWCVRACIFVTGMSQMHSSTGRSHGGPPCHTGNDVYLSANLTNHRPGSKNGVPCRSPTLGCNQLSGAVPGFYQLSGAVPLFLSIVRSSSFFLSITQGSSLILSNGRGN